MALRFFAVIYFLFFSTQAFSDITSETVPPNTVCTMIQTKDGIVDECADHETSKSDQHCNGMNATNTTCAKGTVWNNNSCSCIPTCPEGLSLDIKTNTCSK